MHVAPRLHSRSHKNPHGLVQARARMQGAYIQAYEASEAYAPPADRRCSLRPAPAADEVRTVFITGFPDDVKERELNNMLRFLPGYEVGACRRVPGGCRRVGCGWRRHALFEACRRPAPRPAPPPGTALQVLLLQARRTCAAASATARCPPRPAPAAAPVRCCAGLADALPQRPGPGLCAVLHRRRSAAGGGCCAGGAAAAGLNSGWRWALAAAGPLPLGRLHPLALLLPGSALYLPVHLTLVNAPPRRTWCLTTTACCGRRWRTRTCAPAGGRGGRLA